MFPLTLIHINRINKLRPWIRKLTFMTRTTCGRLTFINKTYLYTLYTLYTLLKLRRLLTDVLAVTSIDCIRVAYFHIPLVANVTLLNYTFYKHSLIYSFYLWWFLDYKTDGKLWTAISKSTYPFWSNMIISRNVNFMKMTRRSFSKKKRKKKEEENCTDFCCRFGPF